jgi:hypothetical protein
MTSWAQVYKFAVIPAQEKQAAHNTYKLAVIPTHEK